MASTEIETLINGPLATVLEGLEDARKAAVRKRWIILGAAAAVAVVLLVLLRFGVLGWTLAMLALIGGWIWGSSHLDKLGRGLKEPALQSIAETRGLTYQAGGFTADGYEGLHPLLGRPTERTFSDRLAGDEGGGFALYEAVLATGSGKHRQEQFRGLVFSLARAPVLGETVIVPDKGLFNIFKPSGGMQRVKFEDDAEFEKRFEVYSTQPDQARALVNPVVREKLKGWRQAYGKVVVRIAGGEAAVALGKRENHFEVGDMGKSVPAAQRIQGMLNDVEQTTAMVREIRATFG